MAVVGLTVLESVLVRKGLGKAWCHIQKLPPLCIKLNITPLELCPGTHVAWTEDRKKGILSKDRTKLNRDRFFQKSSKRKRSAELG